MAAARLPRRPYVSRTSTLLRRKAVWLIVGTLALISVGCSPNGKYYIQNRTTVPITFDGIEEGVSVPPCMQVVFRWGDTGKGRAYRPIDGAQPLADGGPAVQVELPDKVPEANADNAAMVTEDGSVPIYDIKIVERGVTDCQGIPVPVGG